MHLRVHHCLVAVVDVLLVVDCVGASARRSVKLPRKRRVDCRWTREGNTVGGSIEIAVGECECLGRAAERPKGNSDPDLIVNAQCCLKKAC